jgi:hypothetical protein
LSYPFFSPPDSIDSSPFELRTISSKLRAKSAYPSYFGIKLNLPRLEHAIFHLIRVHSSGVDSLLVVDLDGRSSTTSSSGVRLQLCFDTSVHGAEEVGSGIHSLTHGQDTVVLEDHSFLIAKSFCETTPFFVCEDDAAEVVVDGVVFVEANSR